jgi:hypothetical protein
MAQAAPVSIWEYHDVGGHVWTQKNPGTPQNMRFFRGYLQSGRPDSNRRHAAWEATALPTELRPRDWNVLAFAGGLYQGRCELQNG